MKIPHKINPHWQRPDPISDAYQAEIDTAMRKAAKAWRAAVRHAERVQARSDRHSADLDLREAAAVARIAADERWRELKAYEALMVGSRGDRHSGKGSVHRIGNEGTL